MLLTELLSRFHLLRRAPVAAAWGLLTAAGLVWAWRHRAVLHRVRPGLPAIAVAAAIAWIACLAAAAAWLSPPNTYDALAYHMPRVVYWAQNRSVASFPTPYLNQISFPPLAEYFMLHTWILSGGDRWVNLVAWAAFVSAVIGVSSVARAFGAGARAQLFSSLFCATLPGAILQASGAKNDLLLALWLVCLAYFALCRNAPFTGLSLGLALATKATAYIFAPPILLAALLTAASPIPRPRRFAGWLLLVPLLLNVPQYARNYELSGSPLGFDSPFADGRYRFRNNHPGFRAAASNALRNASEQLGSSSPRWNQAVYRSVLWIHARLGLDPQDPAATFQDGRFEPPVNTCHEANANQRWHLLLLFAAGLFAIWQWRRARDFRWLLAAAAPVASYAAFCFYLRWQPWGARLLIPLFIMASPLAGYLIASLRPRWLALPICLFLLDTARLPALENWTRPLRGPSNVFRTPREDLYFADIGGFHNRASYFEAAERVAQSGCAQVGIDAGINQLEYPFQALVRARLPGVRFEHTGIGNATIRYRPREAPPPCAVLCLDCGGQREREALYAPFGPPVALGRFLLVITPAR